MQRVASDFEFLRSLGGKSVVTAMMGDGKQVLWTKDFLEINYENPVHLSGVRGQETNGNGFVEYFAKQYGFHSSTVFSE